MRGLPQCECFFVQIVPGGVGEWEQCWRRYTVFSKKGPCSLDFAKNSIWVAGIICVSKVGRINESQLAVAQLGASLGSTMQVDMERALQSVLGHTCPGACSRGLPSSYVFGNTKEIPKHCS